MQNNNKQRKEKWVLAASIVLSGLIINTSHAQEKARLNCDSTCIVPQTMTQPKVNIATTTKNAGQIPLSAKCGPAAGSVLPSAPSTFLCDTGSTPSSVSSSTVDGGTTYNWTCTNSTGKSVACSANQREVGVCGPDNGGSFSSNPSNLCSSGQSTGFALLGSQYKWVCQGNYGAQASCSATFYVPPPPDPGPSSGGSCLQENVQYVSFYEASTGRTCSGTTGTERCYWGNGIWATSSFNNVACY